MQGRLKDNHLTYISLFSSSGVGCYGFQQEGFECIATNETIERRLNVQKYNNKCRYPSGYVLGDITEEETKNRIQAEMDLWSQNHDIGELDVLIATPPCQGMSVANHKKGDELVRNSLVVESIKLVKAFRPKIFLFENVRTFLNSTCTDLDGEQRRVHEAVELNLGGQYNIHYQLINFKDYGNPSSRTRTLIIGVRQDIQEVTPLELMPALQDEKTVREVIGDLPPLEKMGSIDENDIYHNFRSYAEHMVPWIENTKEGESAFDNEDPERRPHKVLDGKVVFNVNKNGDKYSRCYWDKPAACVHTRNDILSSQSTIHPSENRVFSIREVMRFMSVPDSFKWTDVSEKELNSYSLESKRKFLKKEEINIRQSLGEAVPTTIFRQIAARIKSAIYQNVLTVKEAQKIIAENRLHSPLSIEQFVKDKLDEYSYSDLSKIVELANASRAQHAAYYTRQDICFSVVRDLPDASKFSSLRILEPSVGVGNFLPLLIRKYKSVPSVELDLIDIDHNAIEILKILISKLDIPSNFTVKFLNCDFLLLNKEWFSNTNRDHYDIVVGNPPFGKSQVTSSTLARYKRGKHNTRTSNLCSFFLEEAISQADTVALVLPKSFLSAPEFNSTRNYVAEFAIEKITDYGEKGFSGVKIETISLILNTQKRNRDTKNITLVQSYIRNDTRLKYQDYICSPEFPYWLIYRDTHFDQVAAKLKLGVFVAYRDRQITKSITKSEGRVRVLKSRNIGSNVVVNIPNYDSYVDQYEKFAIAKYINHESAVLVPNLTYNPRACFMPENTIADGSVAILTLKEGKEVTEDHLAYYNSPEFTKFYRIARNYGSRSLNIDNNSAFFFGLPKHA